MGKRTGIGRKIITTDTATSQGVARKGRKIMEFEQAMNKFYEQLELSESARADYYFESIRNMAQLTRMTIKQLSEDIGRGDSYIYGLINNYKKNGSNHAYNSLVHTYNHFFNKITAGNESTKKKLKANLYARYTNLDLPLRYESVFYLTVKVQPVKKHTPKADKAPSKTSKEFEVINTLTGDSVIAKDVPDGFINFYNKLYGALGLESHVEFKQTNNRKTISW